LAGAVAKLALDDGQKETIIAIDRTHQAAVRKSAEQLARARVALGQLLAEPTWNRSQIDKACRKVSALQHQRQLALVNHLASIRKVLTPDQRREFFACLCQQICLGSRAECEAGQCICEGCDGHAK
jgi:Spy/CpxP family protein refolding chaperone